MLRTSDPNAVPRRCRHPRTQLFVLAAAGLVWLAAPHAAKAANADVLQQAVNYMFTGRIDPKKAPEIADRKACVVVVADPKWKRLIRYYLSRLGLDNPRIFKTYAGRQALYRLDVQSDRTVVEYLTPDKKTVTHGYRSAQIPLPGDIDRTRKALQFIAEQCKRDDPQELPF